MREIFEYKKNLPCGIIRTSIKIVTWLFIIIYVLIYQGRFRKEHGLTSSVLVKVKGIGYANEQGVGRKIWDILDMIVPPQEENAVFITTNSIITRNQTQTTCPENHMIQGAQCQAHSDCKKGVALKLGNGIMTGRCIRVYQNINTCEIQAWCPPENDIIDLQKSLINDVANFTIFVKNSIIFNDINIKRSNLFVWKNKSISNDCLYDPKDPLLKYCPIFRISTLIGNSANSDFHQMLTYGGIIQVIITWDCAFDIFRDDCTIEYTTSRMDPGDEYPGRGWSFRYSDYYEQNGIEYRTQFKVYGLRILFEVRGKAGQIDYFMPVVYIGSAYSSINIAFILIDYIINFYLRWKTTKAEKAERKKNQTTTNSGEGAPVRYGSSKLRNNRMSLV